jgi:hypothetical protein
VAAANSKLAPGASLYFRAGQEFFLQTNGGQPLFIQHSQVVVDRYGTGANPILNGEDVIPAVGLLGASAVTMNNLTLKNGIMQPCMIVGGAVNALFVANCLFRGGSIGLFAQQNLTPSGRGNQIANSQFFLQDVDGLSIHGDIHFATVNCTFAYIGVNNLSGGAGDACSSHDTATIGSYNCAFIENRRGAMVNINSSGDNYLVNCSVKSSIATTLVRQDGGGSTSVINCRLHVSGPQLSAAVFAFAGGTVLCAYTSVINDSSNLNSISFFSTASLTVYNSRSNAPRGAFHSGISGAGTFAGDFNTYVQTGTLWIGPTGAIDFAAWQALTNAEANSIGAGG